MTKPNFPAVDPKKSVSQGEEEMLKYWKEQDIFHRSIDTRSKNNEFVFFDGPPFATGSPHYGHILAGTIKDAIPRYWTMKGYRVERKFGWDCHGVPVEFQVEKENKIGGKPGIEKMGVDKFNELCRSIVLRCRDEWEDTVDRMGRFVDFKDDYKTMDPEFMESVWWVFAQLWNKGLIYEGEKVVAYSPKLGSPLSNFEAGLNYQDIDDPAVTVKFKLKDEPNTYILAWTTTPWTLPSNLALCVNEKLNYVKIKHEDRFFIVGAALAEKIFGEDVQIIETIKGKDLVSQKYEPLFPFFKDHENAFQVLADDFVGEEEGTGIVHMAPTGEDDARILTAHNVKLFYPFDENGYFDFSEAKDFISKNLTKEEQKDLENLDGRYFRDDPEVEGSKEHNANMFVLEKLKENGYLFKREQIRHSYPHCWRTDCALMYRGIKTWFVNIQKIKDQMMAQNQNINWIPSHLKDGRFGKMLENAPDWAISRNRFWGAPMPVWRCKRCGKIEVIRSREMLERRSGDKVKDLHKHFVDKIIWPCDECEGRMQRIPEVLDCWFESGSMPYGSYHFPFKFKMDDLEMKEIRTEEEFDAYHEIRMEQIFEQYHSDMGYRKDRPSNNPALHPRIFVWKGKIVGTVRMDELDSNRIRMRFFAFTKEVQGQGLGKKAMQLIESFARQRGFKKLVLASNPKAIKFYEKLGFEKYAWEGCEKFPDSLPMGKEIEGDHFVFPQANFIAEGMDQTRGWFYTLHVLGVALFGQNIYQNVVTNGIVLAEDGQKMSKSKKNYPDPNVIFDKLGADAMRFYLLHSPVVRGENFRFAERGVEEVLKTVILPLKNAYQFFSTYANIDGWKPTKFIFVRHGEADHNVEGVYSGQIENEHHLTALGQSQGKEVAQKLPEYDLLVASPFVRTQETAAIIQNQTQFAGVIKTDQRLRELYFGELEGQKHIPKKDRLENESTETATQTIQRMEEFLQEYSEKYPGKTIVVVSHGGPINCLDVVFTPEAETRFLHTSITPVGGQKIFFSHPEPTHALDQWILSELQTLIKHFRDHFEAYALEAALREIPKFVDNLNNWYLRRSRKRFWASGMSEDKISAYETLHHVLLTLSKILAPVCPFFSEKLYQDLQGGDSVHLQMFPVENKSWIDEDANRKVELEREIVRLAASIRARKKIKLRQPLGKLQFSMANVESESSSSRFLDLDIIAAEANVKSVEFLSDTKGVAEQIVKVDARKVGPRLGKKVQELIKAGKAGDFEMMEDGQIKIDDEVLNSEEYEMGFVCEAGREAEATNRTVVILDTEITEDLELEGYARELIRAIQEMRKNNGFEIADRIIVKYSTDSEKLQKTLQKFSEEMVKEVLAEKIIQKAGGEEIAVDGEKIHLALKVI